MVGAIVVVAVLGALEPIRPLVGGKPMSMVLTTATGIEVIIVMARASNSKVKPLPSRAHGTETRLIPQPEQVTRGTRACR